MLDMKQLGTAEAEIGHPVEQLLTPLSGYRNARPEAHVALDNGAFSRYDGARFRALVDRERPRAALCRFVAVPDVVGSARRTLEVFEQLVGTGYDALGKPCAPKWKPLKGYPIALVCQDGQEDLPIPWDHIAAVFIGGTTEWKLSRHAAEIVKAAKVLGRWAHIGRINTPMRREHFDRLDADSFDGSGLARYSWMREALRDYEPPTAPLFETEALAA